MHVLFLRPSRQVVLNWWWSLRTNIIILFFIMKTQRPKRFSTKIKAPASLSVMSSKLEKLSTIPHLNQNCYMTHFDVATHQLRSTVLDNTFVLGKAMWVGLDWRPLSTNISSTSHWDRNKDTPKSERLFFFFPFAYWLLYILCPGGIINIV